MVEIRLTGVANGQWHGQLKNCHLGTVTLNHRLESSPHHHHHLTMRGTRGGPHGMYITFTGYFFFFFGLSNPSHNNPSPQTCFWGDQTPNNATCDYINFHKVNKTEPTLALKPKQRTFKRTCKCVRQKHLKKDF